MLPLFNFWDRTWFFGNVQYHGTTVHASSHPNDLYMEYMDVSKNMGKTTKMDGKNKGKTLLKWMIWE